MKLPALAWIFVFVGALALDASFAHATSTVGDSQVAFKATGPGGLGIIGKTNELALADDALKFSVSVPLAHLETGIGLRDKHMREKYLEVDRFPQARLTVDRAALRVPASGAVVDADAQGELSLHGVQKHVKFHYRAERAPDGVAVHGALMLDMRDYGINVPSYLGVTVKPDVLVHVDFKTKDL